MSRPNPRRVVVAGPVRIGYQESGPADGPPLVLLHGLASDSDTWDRVIAPLGAHGVRVLAVDLPGHGDSGGSSGYTLADFAAVLLAFLDALSIDSAVVGGHSLGGAIAMELADVAPARVRALVLVSAGGIGREVHLALRAAAVPGADRALGMALRPPLQRVYRHPRVHRLLRLTDDNLTNLRRTRRALGDADGRRVFFASLRAVISPRGQRGSFVDMQRLATDLPMLVVWSEKDPVIPVAHAHVAQAYVPGSEVLVLPGGGHEPHRRHPEAFADAVARFVKRFSGRPGRQPKTQGESS